MAEASTKLHEPAERLSDHTKDIHRAIVSLQEELEAIDWYRQRAEVCTDSALREILEHNMREEIEHASMLLEWLRWRNDDFERTLQTYLYAKGSILEAEERAESGEEGESEPETPVARAELEGFTVGSLKEG
jgi:ferritin-like protein